MVDLRYGNLKDYRGLFAKLQRNVDTFVANPSDDILFNAMVTAWSLTDWVREDVTLTPEMDADLLALTGKAADGRVDHDQLSTAMQICKDITNGSKHAKSTRYIPKVTKIAQTSGTYGNAIYGFSRYGVSGKEYAVVIGEDVHNAQTVLKEAVAQFEQFFVKYNLI